MKTLKDIQNMCQPPVSKYIEVSTNKSAGLGAISNKIKVDLYKSKLDKNCEIYVDTESKRYIERDFGDEACHIDKPYIEDDWQKLESK